MTRPARLRRSMLVRLAVAVLGLVTAAATAESSPKAADTLVLRAEAGLGGVCKPGRWMPVRVWLTNDGADITGEVVLQWGGATLHRSITLAAPARVRLEMYIRTLDTEAAVRIRLRSHGADIRSVDVPVRAASPEEPVTVCVTGAGSQAADRASCTSTMAPESLPRSMRGYDAADRIVWQGDLRGTLSADQRAAAETWEAYHQFEDSGLLWRGPAVRSTAAQLNGPRRPGRVVAFGIGIYLMAMLAVGTRRRPLALYAGVVLLVGIATSISLGVGRIGRGRSVIVRHASTIRQLTGRDSFISMRGVIEYPAFDTFATRASVADVSVASTSGRQSEAWLDDNGYPLLPGVFGLGSRQSFVLEGGVAFAPLEVVRQGDVVRMTNRSAVELGDCRFPEGFSVQRIGALGPGQSVDVREVGPVDEPYAACTVAAVPVEFADAGRQVRTEGPTLLTVYLGPRDVAIAGLR